MARDNNGVNLTKPRLNGLEALQVTPVLYRQGRGERIVPSVGHLAVALAAARVQRAPRGVSEWVWVPLLVALSYLPDADVVAFRLGIPYAAPFGHRGALHSMAFAAGVAATLWGVATWLKVPAARVVLIGGVVLATHGLLDTFTDGGLGIALFWPFSNQRYFAAWTPIPVAPIGTRIFSRDGFSLMLREALMFFPLWVVALWPSRARREVGGTSEGAV